MLLYIFDADFNLVRTLESYVSLRWLEEYNAEGEFELILNDLIESKYIEDGYLIWKKDSELCGIVEYIECKDNEVNIRGRLSTKILEDRIILNTLNITDIETGLRNAVKVNAIDRDKIPYLELGNFNNTNIQGKKEVTFDDLLKLCKDYKEIGFKVKFLPIDKKFVFECYKGQDKSNEIFFRDDMDTLYNTVITQDSTKYKNYAYVYGEGEGAARIWTTVDMTNNKRRKEVYINASDIRKENKSVEDYIQLLQQRGREKLLELVLENSFKTNIVLNGLFKYKIDFNLGDMVTCISRKYNIKFIVRVVAIQEVYDDKGREIVATLGDIKLGGYYG